MDPDLGIAGAPCTELDKKKGRKTGGLLALVNVGNEFTVPPFGVLGESARSPGSVGLGFDSERFDEDLTKRFDGEI